MNKTLHYFLGPVQGFVAQARRTRDLWAGSYLLSYLAANAMNALGKTSIVFPAVTEDALLLTVEQYAKQQGEQPEDREKNTHTQQAALVGSIPNRFIATLSDKGSPKDATEAINIAWKNIASAVRALVDPSEDIFCTTVWDQQINNLWEHQWVIDEQGHWLDRRKNLRNHQVAPEGGEKCTLCGEREELSPIKKPLPREMNTWWKDNIRSLKQVHDLDIKEGERLCAVCLTKRLFPKVAKSAIGWPVPEFYPSTAYLAAIDWLVQLFNLLKRDDLDGEKKAAIVAAANTYIEVVKDTVPHIYYVAERRADIAGIVTGIENTGNNRAFAALDGDLFFLASIQQASYPLEGDEAQQRSSRAKLTSTLQNLYQAIAEVDPPSAMPSPFYAILFMDGDGLGKLLGGCDGDGRDKVSKALAEFTQKVPGFVADHNGVLIYAGGDDVFALLPVNTASSCAAKCREAYINAFEKLVAEGVVKQTAATISAAIEYTHMNTALGVVVKDSHTLLDDIAKNQTGRDALACRVWKRGGPVLTWSQPWPVIDKGKLIDDLCAAFSAPEMAEAGDTFSSQFFYKLRELFEQSQTADGTSHLSDAEIKDLLLVEYLANRQLDFAAPSSESIRTTAKGRIDKLLRLCRQQFRTVDENSFNQQLTPGEYRADGAMLIRFLSQKEV